MAPSISDQIDFNSDQTSCDQINWDVIVVGAGPAGAALACRLRPRYRVLLLERRRLPSQDRAYAYGEDLAPHGTPPIGESLPGAAQTLLRRFGIFERFLADGHAERTAMVASWDSPAPVWFDPLRDPSGPGWHLDRRRFEVSLRAAALKAGAVLQEGCGRLDVSRLDGQWQLRSPGLGQGQRAPVLIDATGRSGSMAQRLGLTRRQDDPLICLYTHLPAVANDQDRCTRLCADANGWWYSVRLPCGRRVLAFHLDGHDPELSSLRHGLALLAKARRQPLLAEVLPAEAGFALDSLVHGRPAGSAALDLAGLAAIDGFYAVGDAAIAFDPIASQGLFHALASAEGVANAIDRQFAGQAQPQAAYIAELEAVYGRYRAHLQATYAGPQRFSSHSFWARRLAAPAPAPAALVARQAVASAQGFSRQIL
jgi:flavin-dependent dehydrogenase